MTDIPILETPRLRLTALAERHFDAYADMLADPESTRYVGSGVPLDRMNAWRSMAMLLGHWTLRGFGMWAVERREDDVFVGRVGLMFPEGWPSIELGWMLRPEHRGNGYATEAGHAALDYAWQRLHIPRVISLVRNGNEASDRVAKRLGGEFVESIDFHGSPTHVFAYYSPQRDAAESAK
ncbi:GNAT family N-acetyltransferase [Oleiagrimonas soli]|uniref:GCN5 family acetyltransferase n=1 Tax=Oleiagrimonas soli TaxID=1543381 RepID=A0A099CVV1_9GAMM|nr:GNAT family N-acetyltransferase [Oleiagrimonas soli]KGI77762.1 GCN5 family acetyltransferase [Oleiagrimonas soli]MBB6183919.1 RimJ/RimL family protein N-acetyltransferase [Oleiagrimonas soli]